MNKCYLKTVIQISITGTDVPVVVKIASVGGEALGDDVLLLDPDGPTTLQSKLCLALIGDVFC